MICGRASGGHAGNHHYFADLVLGDERIPEDECQFGGSEGNVISFIIHRPDALFECK